MPPFLGNGSADYKFDITYTACISGVVVVVSPRACEGLRCPLSILQVVSLVYSFYTESHTPIIAIVRRSVSTRRVCNDACSNHDIFTSPALDIPGFQFFFRYDSSKKSEGLTRANIISMFDALWLQCE